MDYTTMGTRELIGFLTSKGISIEICDLLEENAIDGCTLQFLMEDIQEFIAVLPKSGHRLQLKRLLKSAMKGKDKMDDVSLNVKEVDADEPVLSQPSTSSSTPTSIDLSDDSGKGTDNDKAIDNGKETNNGKPKPQPFQNKTLKQLETNALPDNLPFPERLSVHVEVAISKGSTLPVRKQLIADVGSFYFGLSSHPRQGDYKRIAIMLCDKFPELKDSNPSSYWITVQKQLSQYFRNQRRYSTNQCSPKRKSTNNTTAKKVKLHEEDNGEVQKRNLELLRDAKAGSMSNKTYKSLIKDTFCERRKFIQSTATSSIEVLTMCPYLGNPENPSTNPESLFRNKMVEFRLTCIGSPESISQVFVSGEDQSFLECKDTNLLKALINLICAYYVFDVSYPDSMEGILYFLQDIGLQVTDNTYRGTKYSTFMSELRNAGMV